MTAEDRGNRGQGIAIYESWKINSSMESWRFTSNKTGELCSLEEPRVLDSEYM